MKRVNPDSTRFSRDGDPFHYLWAARRCLELLSPDGTHDRLSIEGSDNTQNTPQESDAVLDAVAYHKPNRSSGTEHAVRYQLKHSTVDTHGNQTLSLIERTINRFAEIHKDSNQTAENTQNVTFVVVTNKPISPELEGARSDFANGDFNQTSRAHLAFRDSIKLPDNELASFCAQLQFLGNQNGFIEQGQQLALDTNAFLSSQDADAPARLKNLVTNKATSKGINNNTITREDVLRALETDYDSLYPAPSQIEGVSKMLNRYCYSALIKKIISETSHPIIVEAEGGVGKSVFAAKVGSLLPSGSVCVIYDCFANGSYRNPSKPRHSHKNGLVQIANGLAAKGLCKVLIPSNNAPADSYLRAFLLRLRQSIGCLKLQNKNALLFIVIDAADNAQLQASERNYGAALATDLLREPMPEGVRLALTSRPYRVGLLNPPPDCLRLTLDSFDESETEKHLTLFGFTPSANELSEFHALSSHNPRLQTKTLADATNRRLTLRTVLDDFGLNPKTVNDALNNLFQKSLLRLKDQSNSAEQAQLKRLCTGLAVLPPLIPMSVLALLANVTESQIHSFAVDIGRPLSMQ